MLKCCRWPGGISEGNLQALYGRDSIHGNRKYYDGCRKEGGNRQELHEKIRQLSMQAGKTVKEEGKDNNLVDLIAADPAFGLTKEQIEANLKPELYVGRAPRQVEVFLRDVVRPVLDAHKEELGVTAEINV